MSTRPLRTTVSSTPPPLELTVGSWRLRAACLGHPTLPPVTWDDDLGLGRRETAEARDERIAKAKAVCFTECPVRRPCGDDVNLDYDTGVRGGEDLRDVREALGRAAANRALTPTEGRSAS